MHVQVFSGQRVWAELSDFDVLMNKMNKVALPVPDVIPSPLAALIRKCTATDPEARPSFLDIQVSWLYCMSLCNLVSASAARVLLRSVALGTASGRSIFTEVG